MDEDRGDITILLSELKRGNQEAASRLLGYVYPELRRLASGYLRRERPGHTLQPTALVHEAYVRLVHDRPIDWRDRAHFLGFAATVMRRVLVEYARSRRAAKRGGMQRRVELGDDLAAPLDQESARLLDLNSALERMAKMDERMARAIELRYFGGLSAEEAAEVLGVSSRTLKRDWTIAKAWLKRELEKDQKDGRGTMGAG